jgi:glucose-6-phosphate isomerase
VNVITIKPDREVNRGDEVRASLHKNDLLFESWKTIITMESKGPRFRASGDGMRLALRQNTHGLKWFPVESPGLGNLSGGIRQDP